MIISKTFEKISYCLEISESMHLSNKEEEKVILELVRNFNKLMKQVLTKNEISNFKQKVKVIRNLKS